MAIELTQEFLQMCFQKVNLSPLSLNSLSLNSDVSEIVTNELAAWGLALSYLGALPTTEDKIKDVACHVRSFFIDETGEFRPHRSLLFSETQWGALMSPSHSPYHAPFEPSVQFSPPNPPTSAEVHLSHWKKARF